MRHRGDSRAFRSRCPLKGQQDRADGGRAEHDCRADQWQGLLPGEETPRKDRRGDTGSTSGNGYYQLLSFEETTVGEDAPTYIRLDAARNPTAVPLNDVYS